MNPLAASFPADDLGRLYEKTQRWTAVSRKSLDAALVVAWHAGRRLLAEKKRVRRAMGRGAWPIWLQANFPGPVCQARRYMRLAQTIADPSFLPGISLRRAYAILGVPTEPKPTSKSARLRGLPSHLGLGNRLWRTLRRHGDWSRLPPPRVSAYRKDLRALYEALRPLYERPVAR